MATTYVLSNQKAGNSQSQDRVKALETVLQGEVKTLDVSSVTDYNAFLSGLGEDDRLILAGGDGTINRFVNDTEGIPFEGEVLYFPNGTGNDFARDLGLDKESDPFPITPYLKKLPTVTVKGKRFRFVNAVGYGIDGYCCQVGDELKKTSEKKINYTAIAIKGLLFHYKPTNAHVCVDGKEYDYKRVWIAPTMQGRFYGGGMMPTPDQSRTDREGRLSLMVFHGSGKLKTLMIFPSLFKGEHVKHRNHIAIHSGHEISVTFDRPTALQIDGETILDVETYTAFSSARTEALAPAHCIARQA